MKQGKEPKTEGTALAALDIHAKENEPRDAVMSRMSRRIELIPAQAAHTHIYTDITACVSKNTYTWHIAYCIYLYIIQCISIYIHTHTHTHTHSHGYSVLM